MKNMTQVLLFLAIVCSSTLYSSPVMGTDYNIQTGVAVQEGTTNLTAGLSSKMIEIIDDSVVEKCVIEEYKDGWTICNANIRNKPSTKSKLLNTFLFNTHIQYYKLNNKWAKIKYKSKIAYMKLEYISGKKLKHINYSAPYTSGFKSYMPYTAITSKSSKQYKLQQIAYTGNYGVRMVNNRYCVALGTAFDVEIGQYFDLILENGTVIPCILGDIKNPKDTDSNNMITVSNGCLTEFVVDINVLNSKTKKLGDISYCCEEWNNRVENIRVYEKSAFK